MKIVIGVLIVAFFVFEIVSLFKTVKKVKNNKASTKSSDTAKADKQKYDKEV